MNYGINMEDTLSLIENTNSTNKEFVEFESESETETAWLMVILAILISFRVLC